MPVNSPEYIQELQARIAELEAALEEYCCTGTEDSCGCYALYMKDKNAEADTIERCAQVVKQWIDKVGVSLHGRDLNTLLAIIRALQDKP